MRKAGSFALLAIQVLIITGFWAWYHVNHPMGNQLTGEATGQLLAWGRLAGLLAAFVVLLQLILIGRVGWVEHAFGLDRLTRLHHVVGFALLALLLAHPILLVMGHARQADVGIWPQMLDFLKEWEDVGAAAAGLVLMMMALIFSVVVLMRRMRYEIWYATHLTLYVALALTFGHQLAVGGDLAGNRWFAGYWYALYAFVFGNLLIYRVLRPLRNHLRHHFVVARVVPESTEVTSVHIDGRRLGDFHAAAGQFVMVRFLAPGFRWEAHPFSLSRRPDGTGLRLTIKRLGDFTRRIPELKPGIAVLVDGPHGVFTVRRSGSSKVLLIAGGIGITPIRALAEDLVAAGRDTLLLYGNRTADTIVFRRELDDLAASSGGRLKIVHVLSDDPSWTGERGRMDRALFERLVTDLRERDVFLCGPPPMMKAVRATLENLGVPSARLHDERFAM